MKKTVEAIKYGLETLNITPKEMFSLIESSKGYDGNDYNRWLANEIIKIAEKDEVGYSQLLAKWFNIIQGIIEEHIDEEICDEFKLRVKEKFKGKVYTYGVPEGKNDYGVPLDVDWSAGLDLPFNYEFIEGLPDEVRDAIEGGEDITFLIRLGVDGKMGGSPLMSDAKANGVVLKSYDALLIYRIATIYRALGDSADHLHFVVIGNTEFFYNPDNADLVKYFLSYVRYGGIAVDSKDLYEISYTNESYAILTCRSWRDGDKAQNGIQLPKILKDGSVVDMFRYSRGSDMWSSLMNFKLLQNRTVDVPVISETGNIVSTIKDAPPELGYLCNSVHLSNPVVSACPIAGSDSVALTKGNFRKCLAYFGVVTSLRGQRLSSDITDIITGHPEYMNLVGNCLPLLLFDINGYWGDVTGEINEEGCVYRLPDFEEFIRKEIESLSVYFSYEAKELMEFGKKIWQTEGEWGMSFDEVLGKVNRSENPNISKEYLTAVSRCQSYVCSLYRSMA